MERLKNLFTALIVVIVTKMADIKDSLNARIDALSTNFDTLKTYVEAKVPQAFEAISTLSDRVTSEVAGLNTAIENLNTALTTKINGLKTELTSYIQTEVASLVQKIGEDDGRLQELVDSVTALAQADQGLVSTAGRQVFDATQQGTARDNIGAASQQYVSEEFANVNVRIDALNNDVVDYETLKIELVDFINSEFSARGL
jgi:hypothetical protein